LGCDANPVRFCWLNVASVCCRKIRGRCAGIGRRLRWSGRACGSIRPNGKSPWRRSAGRGQIAWPAPGNWKWPRRGCGWPPPRTIPFVGRREIVGGGTQASGINAKTQRSKDAMFWSAWQSAAATPLFGGGCPFPKRRGALLPAAVQMGIQFSCPGIMAWLIVSVVTLLQNRETSNAEHQHRRRTDTPLSDSMFGVQCSTFDVHFTPVSKRYPTHARS